MHLNQTIEIWVKLTRNKKITESTILEHVRVSTNASFLSFKEFSLVEPSDHLLMHQEEWTCHNQKDP